MEYVEGRRWKIEHWNYPFEVTSIWNKKSTHQIAFYEVQEKTFSSNRKSQISTDLEEEETIETVAILHDNEKETETQGLFKHNYSLQNLLFIKT